MNRQQRRSAERRLQGVERTRVSLEEELRLQAVELCSSVPGPGETIDQAIEALEAGILDLSEPRWGLVAGPAVAELVECRDALLRRKALP